MSATILSATIGMVYVSPPNAKIVGDDWTVWRLPARTSEPTFHGAFGSSAEADGAARDLACRHSDRLLLTAGEERRAELREAVIQAAREGSAEMRRYERLRSRVRRLGRNLMLVRNGNGYVIRDRYSFLSELVARDLDQVEAWLRTGSAR